MGVVPPYAEISHVYPCCCVAAGDGSVKVTLYMILLAKWYIMDDEIG
jgi:hypothetical protein